MSAYADCEPLIPDERLAPIEDAVKRRYFPWLEEASFITARVLNPLGVWEAHFVLMAPNVKEPQRSLGIDMAQVGRTLLRDWEASEQEREHFVSGKPDPARAFFMWAGDELVKQMKSLKELITDDLDRKIPQELVSKLN